MVHLRYIKKNGKVYGPYSYKSIRTKNGKIKNIYLGRHQKNTTKNVVQKIFLMSAVLALFFTIIFLLKNPEGPTGLIILENELGEEIGKYEIEQTTQNYNIKINNNEKEESSSEIIIQGIESLPERIETKIGPVKENNEIKTEIFAVKEELNFDKAILKLKKEGEVNSIFHCEDFDFENFKCENWKGTDIPFTDIEDYIEFEVTHFTAYAGGGTGDDASNLTIWDDTDTEGGSNKRYSEGCQIPVSCSSKTQTYFFANYTNNTGGDNQPINTSSSNCSVSFHLNLTSDDEDSWTTHVNMTYSTDRGQYEYNKSFNYRGVFYYNISCWDDNYDDNSTLDTFTISNSEPYIVEDPLPNLNCNEDEWCYLNFSYNCTDPDHNDADSLTYNISSTISNVMWFNTSNGNLSVFCTNENNVFDETFELTVNDGVAADAANLRIIVSAVNDAPTSTLTDQALYEDESWQINLSDYYSDEENDLLYFRENNTEAGTPLFINISYSPIFPYTLNGEIMNCSPTNAEVGNYSLNITANDTAGNELSQIIVFDVRNVNDPPSLDWVCTDNDTNHTATENTKFECAANATDDDLIWGDNLTFTANETWFTFEWQSNNESNVSFTPADSQVGFWWISIIVTDKGGVTDSKLINITIFNISDIPVLSQIGNFTVYENVPYTFSINATDGDLLIPQNEESLNFSINDTSLFTLGDAYVQDNVVYSDISFTPPSTSGGTEDFWWINFSVNDTEGNIDSELVNITVRNNTAPLLIATVNNNATEDHEFYINLTENVTDYDGDEILWSDNTTLFDIDITTGEINFTANDSYVGENWVNITVRDYPPGANNSQVLNFTIYNVEDVPNFTEPIGNHTATEDTEFYLVINATDEDLYIPDGNVFGISESLTFTINDTLLFNIIKDGEANATINFTAINSSQAGLYWFEINVTDTTGRSYNETINITIIAVNDVPQFTDFDNITNATQEVLVYYDFAASDEENGTDTFDGVDSNLTFWLANITNATDGNLVDSTTITLDFFGLVDGILNSTTGVLSLTPNATHAGVGTGNVDYKLNISVNDSDGAMASVIINLSIRNENDAPEIILWTASGFGTAEDITMYENDTNMTFTVYTRDLDGDPLDYNWTIDGVVNESEVNKALTSTTTGSDNFQWSPNFTDAGLHNLTVFVSDDINTTHHFWNITVLNLNSPPRFILTIQNITWNQDTTYTNLDLDDHFFDIENQTGLNFTFDQFDENLSSLDSSQITVEVNDTSHVVTFTPASSWYGSEYIKFHANDSIDNVSSNYVFLTVTEVEVTAVTTVTQPSAGGGGGAARKELVTIDIIHPGALTLFKEDLLISPIIIKNTNSDITLRDIDIVIASSFENLELSLSETHIAQLAPGEEKEVLLSIKGVSKGFEEIIVEAVVHDPEVTDSAKIFVTILTMPKALEERILFVKDLFKENPECLELNELIARAERDIAAKQYDAALEKINTAIDKCKDLISVVHRMPEKELMKEIDIKRIILLISLNIISVAFMIFIITKIIKKRKRGLT